MHRRRVLQCTFQTVSVTLSTSAHSAILFTLAFHLAVFRDFIVSFMGRFFMQPYFLSVVSFVYEVQIALKPAAEEKLFWV